MLRSSHRFTKALLPLCGALVALTAASPASAATVEKVGGDHITFAAQPGEDNSLAVYDSGPDIVLKDDNVDLDPIGGGCVQIVNGDVKCPSAGVTNVYLLMSDGTNSVQTLLDISTYIEGFTATANTFQASQSGPVQMEGSPNHDQLAGSAGKDTIDGNGGPDYIAGGSNEDVLRGGSGNDSLRPGQGPDIVQGDGDVDSVTYADRSEDEAVRVSLFDNVANDGELGEGDNVKSDVENIEGGEGDDTLTGTAGPTSLYGGKGHDTLYGGGGQDFLSGQDDGDNLFGQAGEDTGSGGEGGDLIDGGTEGDELYGDSGADTLDGGSGEDDLDGGADNDGISGGTQDDVLYGKDGNDLLAGNAGADKLFGEAGDDTVIYPGVTAPLRVDLDGVGFDDGPDGEGDTAGADVERVTGGPAADVLTGNGSANVLRGGGGNDTLDGLGGADSLFGELGDDNLLSRDGVADTDDCGAGSDTFSADAVDTLVGCEPPAGQGGAAQGGGGAVAARTATVAGPALRIGPGSVRLNRRGQATLRVTCSAKAKTRCIGTLRLQRKGKGKAKTSTIGSKRFSIKSGRSAVVRITLSRRTQRSIGRRGLQVKAMGSARDVVSAARTTTRKVTISRARR